MELGWARTATGQVCLCAPCWGPEGREAAGSFLVCPGVPSSHPARMAPRNSERWLLEPVSPGGWQTCCDPSEACSRAGGAGQGLGAGKAALSNSAHAVVKKDCQVYTHRRAKPRGSPHKAETGEDDRQVTSLNPKASDGAPRNPSHRRTSRKCRQG